MASTRVEGKLALSEWMMGLGLAILVALAVDLLLHRRGGRRVRAAAR